MSELFGINKGIIGAGNAYYVEDYAGTGVDRIITIGKATQKDFKKDKYNWYGNDGAHYIFNIYPTLEGAIQNAHCDKDKIQFVDLSPEDYEAINLSDNINDYEKE